MTDKKWFPIIDRNEATFWIGLVMMFIGLALSVSVATALLIIGGVIALESLATSYLATWMAIRKGA